MSRQQYIARRLWVPSGEDAQAARKASMHIHLKHTKKLFLPSFLPPFLSFFFFLSPFLPLSFLSSLCPLGTNINFDFLLPFACRQEQKLPQAESLGASDSWGQTRQLPSTARDSPCEAVSCEYLTVSGLCKKCCHGANWLETP